MRVDNFFSFDFTFDQYTPRVDGTQTTFEFQKAGTGIVVPGTGGITIITKEALVIGAQVRNLKDRRGKSVLVTDGVEYPLYVQNADPQFSPYSELIAWKQNLKRDTPRNVGDLYNRIADGL